MRTRVMLIEDDAVIAASTKMVLEEVGYSVSSVHDSGKEAIESIRAKRPDVVLMDVQLLGGMSGLEVAEHVISMFRLPVVLLTAYYDDAIAARAADMGALYLKKPASAQDMQRAIEQAVNRAA